MREECVFSLDGIGTVVGGHTGCHDTDTPTIVCHGFTQNTMINK